MFPIAAASPAAKQGKKIKQHGNIYFKKDRSAASIDTYMKATTLCPDVSEY